MASILAVLGMIAAAVFGVKKRQVEKARERVGNAKENDALTKHERDRDLGEIKRVDEVLKKAPAPLPENDLWKRLREQGKLKD